MFPVEMPRKELVWFLGLADYYYSSLLQRLLWFFSSSLEKTSLWWIPGCRAAFTSCEGIKSTKKKKLPVLEAERNLVGWISIHTLAVSLWKTIGTGSLCFPGTSAHTTECERFDRSTSSRPKHKELSHTIICYLMEAEACRSCSPHLQTSSSLLSCFRFAPLPHFSSVHLLWLIDAHRLGRAVQVTLHDGSWAVLLCSHVSVSAFPLFSAVTVEPVVSAAARRNL